jgi:hypothetical protein
MQLEHVHFSPFAVSAGARARGCARGCFTCRYYEGRTFSDHVVCEHRLLVPIVAVPREGCAFWELAPGADDE